MLLGKQHRAVLGQRVSTQSPILSAINQAVKVKAACKQLLVTALKAVKAYTMAIDPKNSSGELMIYKKHVFVCVSGKTCPDQGSQAVLETLKEEIAQRGLKGSIRINKAGCLAQCGNGPMVVVYPQGTWYAHVQVADCREIVELDLVGDQVVTRLLYNGLDKILASQ